MLELISEILGILIAPIALFLIFAAPLWMILHYRHRNKTVYELGTNDQNKIAELQQIAEKMEERLMTMENILDSEHSGWRNNL